jgi:predicted ArsR family transcriptional regulator
MLCCCRGFVTAHSGKPLSVEGAILKLLEQHDSLGYEQIAQLLNRRPGEVRQALERLRERGLVAVLAVGEHAGEAVQAASYWRLTDEGRSTVAKGQDE